ncbi:unnamed protein product, partial [Mesorhabditis belari]|uniref:tRNA-uridine aminocarboxypropyltransferase 1 n=1 Tax=Mesorhabditis belari TaxID=2138241 RepID=A0AAF3EPE9_9BILA
MYFCYDCHQTLSDIFYPQVELPCKVDVIKHPKEKNSKSTAIHCKLAAPSKTQIYDTVNLPDYRTNFPEERVVLVFPTPGAQSIEEFVAKEGKIDRFVFLDSTWFQVGVMQKLPQINGLPCVHLKKYKTIFWRTQHNLDDHHLATIEAIYYSLLELRNALNKESYQMSNFRHEDVDLLLNLGQFSLPTTSQPEARNTPGGSDRMNSASPEDVVDLSSDDEDEQRSIPINKIFRSPTISLRFPSGQVVKREATMLTDLLQRRYIDSFAIDPLMQTVINGSKFQLGYVGSQSFTVWQNLVKKYKLDQIHDPKIARQFLDENPSAANELRKNFEIKNFACDTSKPYTAIVVFLPNGNHWYLIVVSHYAQWLDKKVIDRHDTQPAFVHVFDSLLQDIERSDGQNYRVLPQLHDREMEGTLFPIMRFAALVFKEDPGLFKTKLHSRAVREVFGQGTNFDCGAFVLLYAEKIANGELIETTSFEARFTEWQWKDADWISYDNQKMQLQDMLFYRALCYQRAKDMVSKGKEILEVAEERLTNGESAFEGDPKFDSMQGLINRQSLASIGFKAKTAFPIQSSFTQQNKILM